MLTSLLQVGPPGPQTGRPFFCSALRTLQPPDRANWHPECLAAEDKRRAQEADVADVVMFEFMADELTWQLVELTIAAKVMRPGPVPGLSKVRPLATA